MFVVCYLCFFFFKQKTAYEMRISDWSSDVCSSDLAAVVPDFRHRAHAEAPAILPEVGGIHDRMRGHRTMRIEILAVRHIRLRLVNEAAAGPVDQDAVRLRQVGDVHQRRAVGRSEEHTSELQSLMRISYAVFCLKKKNNGVKSKQQL